MSDDSLRKLYAFVLRCRMTIEARSRWFSANSAADELDSALGLEATEVATLLDLVARDTVAPAKREFVTRVATGAPLKEVLGEPSSNNRRGRGTKRKAQPKGDTGLNIIPPFSEDAQSLQLATGVAAGYRLLKRRNVVVAFSAASSAGLEPERELLSYAAAQRLPIVYVAVTAETSGDHKDWADPNTMPTIVVDGNDPVAVYRVAHEAIDHARTGGGPTIIECRTRFWNSGQGSEELPSNGTEQQELADPIAHLERYLAKRGLWSAEWKSSIIADCEREISEALATTETSSR